MLHEVLKDRIPRSHSQPRVALGRVELGDVTIQHVGEGVRDLTGVSSEMTRADIAHLSTTRRLLRRELLLLDLLAFPIALVAQRFSSCISVLDFCFVFFDFEDEVGVKVCLSRLGSQQRRVTSRRRGASLVGRTREFRCDGVTMR